MIYRKRGRLTVNIIFTEKAKNQLKNTLSPNIKLKLIYDTEDCGCVVNGVTALAVVEAVDKGDVEIQTNHAPVWMEKSKQVFFDEEMTIDFLPAYNCYQLRSSGQILNPRMRVVK
jgi:uncharacterized protein YqkB